MPWAFTTVSATTTGTTSAASATAAVSLTLVGNYGVTQSLFADSTQGASPVDGSVGATTIGLRTSSGSTGALGTNPVPGATFLNGTVIHTITGYTAGTRRATFTPALTTAIANNASITLNPAIQVGALVIMPTTTTGLSGVYAVMSVSNASNSVVSVRHVEHLLGLAATTASLQLSFYNPLTQLGTDTALGSALSGLAEYPAEIVNCFVNHPTSGTYAIGTTSIVIGSTTSGGTPAISPTILSSFTNNTVWHYVTNYDAPTRTISFTPALNASLASSTRLRITTPGVLVNPRNTGSGISTYTINNTCAIVLGTLSWNAWAEQLIFAASCPTPPQGGVSTGQLMLAGVTTISGALTGWQSINTGTRTTSPALIFNQRGNVSNAQASLRSQSGSVNTFDNVSIHHNSLIGLEVGTNTYTNVSFSGFGIVAVYGSSSTINGLSILNSGYSFPVVSGSVTIQSLLIDGSTIFANQFGPAKVTLIDPIFRNNALLAMRGPSSATAAGLVLTNMNLGTANIFTDSGIADGSSSQLGFNSYFLKQVNHYCQNLSSLPISSVKIFSADSLNRNQFDWFSNGITNGGYFVASQLGSAWNGANRKTYLQTTTTNGTSTQQSITLGYVIAVNQRKINLVAFAKGSFQVGATNIIINNGTGLFPIAPELNGTFFYNNTRHVISGITTNTGTNDYSLTIAPGLTAILPTNTVFLIQNTHYDYRNKTTIAASADPALINATTILIDNGSGSRTTIQPTINSNFIYNNTYHNITAVGSGTANKWQLTIEPGLSAAITTATPITISNISGQDFYNFKTASYLHLPQEQDLNLTGTGVLTNTWVLLSDITITEVNKSTVDLYTTLTTARRLYDRAKSWWYDNFETLTASQQSSVLFSRFDTTLNAGSYNLTLATSGSVFAVSGNTITINAPTFTDTLTTTGTITLNNPSTTAINYASGSVPSGGTVALAVAGNYNLSNWTFASGAIINNVSNGAVTIQLGYYSFNAPAITLSGTPTPTANYLIPLTITNLISNSRVRVTRVDTGAELTKALVTGTSVSFAITYQGAIRVEARNASGATAYKPWVAVATLAGIPVTLTASQEVD